MSTTFDDLSQKQTNKLQELLSDLFYMAKTCFKIKDKQGQIIPLVFNKAQKYLHKKIEEQKKTLGYVRVLGIKGRQQGFSTYVAARYFKETHFTKGKGAFILSHQAKSTTHLFRMTNRYYENLPEVLKIPLDVASRNELVFEGTDSSYAVGTAGSGDVGRSMTVQLFHGSEVAFWENTDDIETGILQTIIDAPGTEIILESTANGMSNMFYRKCMDALAGKGEYILIFVPWFWQDEYRKKIPEGFSMTTEEALLASTHGLEPEQIYWRRLKRIELGADWKFKQEYPSTVMEAFQTSGSRLIAQEDIVQARKSTIKDTVAPLIIGVDPARTGDRTIISFRRGREFERYIKYDEMKQDRLAYILARLIDRYKPAKVFIDTGHGYGTIDLLHSLGYAKIVVGVCFQEAPIEEFFLNKRAEMLIAVRDWIESGGVSIPDDEEVQCDLACIPDFEETPTRKIYFPSKKKIKEQFGFSPDITDSLALTFAYPVKQEIQSRVRRITRSTPGAHNSPLTTLNTRRNGGVKPRTFKIRNFQTRR